MAPRGQPGGSSYHLPSLGLGTAGGEVGSADRWKVVSGPWAQQMVGKNWPSKRPVSPPGKKTGTSPGPSAQWVRLTARCTAPPGRGRQFPPVKVTLRKRKNPTHLTERVEVRLVLLLSTAPVVTLFSQLTLLGVSPPAPGPKKSNRSPRPGSSLRTAVGAPGWPRGLHGPRSFLAGRKVLRGQARPGSPLPDTRSVHR